MNDNVRKRKSLLVYGVMLSVFIICGYALTYQFEPFSEFINNLILNLLTIISAMLCALIISRIVFYYEKGEPLRSVWISFAIALWMWTVAEIVWSIYNLTVGEVPGFSLADVLWMAAYVFLAAALTNQFRLVLFDHSKRSLRVGAIISLVVLAVVFLVTWLTGGSLEGFAGYFYPAADFSVGMAALILVISFRGGTMALPWLSLLGFMISDSLYTWATASGVYGWSAGNGILTLLIDLIYIIAYLFMAWSLFNQYLTLRFGATIPGKTVPVIAKPASQK